MKQALFCIALPILFFASCRKTSVAPVPPATPINENPRVAIKLNADYLTTASVDSAMLMWEINGQVQETKMQLSNDTLFAPTKNFTKGGGRLTIQIFSNLQSLWYNLQWEKRQELTMTDKVSINWHAPASFSDTNWMPRVIMLDPLTNFGAIIGIRPTDPYFLLKNVPPGYKIELDRIYMRIPGGAQFVASGMWTCNTVCTDGRGNIENREFFRPLATQIAGKEWRGYNTGVGLIGPNNTSGPGFFYTLSL